VPPVRVCDNLWKEQAERFCDATVAPPVAR